MNWKPLALILLLGIAARIAALALMQEGCFLTREICAPPADQHEYLGLARSLLHGEGYRYEHGFSDPSMSYTYRPPGYPGVLAVFLAITGDHLLGARLLQVLLSLAIPLSCWLLGRRFLSPRWAWILAAGASLSPFFFYFSGYFLSEALYPVLFLGGLTAACLMRSTTRPRLTAALAGALLGWAAITRSEGFYLGCLILVFVTVLAARRRLAWSAAALSILLFALPVMGWMAHNYSVHGHAGLQSRILANNLLLYSRSEVTGVSWPEGDRWAKETWEIFYATRDDYAADQLVKRSYLNLIRQYPWKFVHITFAKAAQVWKVFPQKVQIGGATPYQSRWFDVVALLFYGVWIPFALLGVVVGFRRFPVDTTLLILVGVANTFMVAAVNQGMRHRIALMALVYLFATLGVASLAGVLPRLYQRLAFRAPGVKPTT